MVIVKCAVIICAVIAATVALYRFGDDAAEFFTLVTGCVVGNFIYELAPLTPEYFIAIVAGCAVGQFAYKKISR